MLALLGVVTAGAARAGARGPNLLLITLDTTRADHLGCYGDEAARTPALDGLAAGGTLFEEAFSPCPLTLPAHTTILTGLEPPEHGLRVNGRAALAPSVPTLATLLRERGYATGAFVAAYVLARRFGLDRGFEVYDDDLSRRLPQDIPEQLSVARSGDQVVDGALAWLATLKERPFFCWVHLYDAHYPYERHPELAGTRYADTASYDGDVAFMDLQVGRLLAYLDARGLRTRTLVVAVGDHGEGLEEHGEVEHGYLLNTEALHVPLIVARPGTVAAGHRATAVVSLADLLPTILEQLDLPPPGRGHGRSLGPALRGADLPSVASYAETDLPFAGFGWSPLRSLLTDGWHYIRTARPELYDRRTDPAELRNLAPLEPAILRRLDGQLRAREGELAAVATTPAPTALDAAVRRRLEALGYVSPGAGGAPAAAPGALRDIKDMLPVKDLSTILRRGIAEGRLSPAEVERMSRELVRRSPETALFQAGLGSQLLSAGRLDEAEPYLAEALRLRPDLAEAHCSMGNLRMRQHRLDDAQKHYRRALELEPDLAEAHLGLGNALAAGTDLDGAVAQYHEALRLSPEMAEVHYDLGNVLARRGDRDGAAREYEAALAVDPDLIAARFNLGQVYEQQGRPDEAIRCYREVVRRQPRFTDARNALALLLLAQGHADEARVQLDAAVRANPRSAQTHYNLATLFAGQHHVAKAIAHAGRAVELAPDEPEYLNGLAWLLATAAASHRRDGDRALALAERACALTRRHNPRMLDTLAAAYAAVGRPADAGRTAREAARVARAAGQTAVAAESARLADLYAGHGGAAR